MGANGSLIDLTGRKFGRLTVICRAEDAAGQYAIKRPLWLCRCDCGNLTTVIGANLREGMTKSCGCLRIEKSRENGIARLGKKKGEPSR